MEIMRTNEIDEVDINNGKLIYSKKNVKKPTPVVAKVKAKAGKNVVAKLEDSDNELSNDNKNSIDPYLLDQMNHYTQNPKFVFEK